MAHCWVIDCGLATVGLAVAFASVDSTYGVLLCVPLIGLLSVFAAELRRGAGTQFDPTVVDALVAVVERN
jgi:hypothetical protein